MPLHASRVRLDRGRAARFSSERDSLANLYTFRAGADSPATSAIGEFVSSALTTITFDFWNTLYSADHGSWRRVKPLHREAATASEQSWTWRPTTRRPSPCTDHGDIKSGGRGLP